MIAMQRIEVAGQHFVLIEESEYERLCTRAGETVAVSDDGLPPLPQPDAHGRFPAVEYMRISLARDVIRDRRAAGLTQQELADLARTRQETISRIESGRYTPSVKLIDRIEAALRMAMKARAKKKLVRHKTKKGRGR
jgi:DNA-binding XRE family transcriptional regulator